MLQTACPTRAELACYVKGTLPESAAIPIAEHLETCLKCEGEVQSLERSEDALLEILRVPIRSDEFERDLDYRRALAIVGSIGHGRAATAGGATSTNAGADSKKLGMVGQYTLLSVLGSGGMGTVYKAVHNKLKKVVALKVLLRDRLKDDHVVQRFQREIEAVGRLEHPNLVRAMDAGEIDGTQFLVMEYVNGIDLATLQRGGGPLSVADASELIRQAAIGMQGIHEHGLVHRDIKPSNLMLTHDGKLKILDLGLARYQNQTEEGRPQEFTHTSQVMGTADYMAPEQALESRSVDIRADIYSLGCTFYRLLANRAPFSGRAYDDPLKKVLGHARDTAPSLDDFRDDVPDALVAIIDRMMAKAPQDRYQQPGEVADVVAPFAATANLKALAVQKHKTSGKGQPMTASGTSTSDWIASAFTNTTPNLASTRSRKASAWLPGSARRWGLLVAIALMVMGSFLTLWQVIVRVRHGDGTTNVVTAPQGSAVTVDPAGNVDVALSPAPTEAIRNGSTSGRSQSEADLDALRHKRAEVLRVPPQAPLDKRAGDAVRLPRPPQDSSARIDENDLVSPFGVWQGLYVENDGKRPVMLGRPNMTWGKDEIRMNKQGFTFMHITNCILRANVLPKEFDWIELRTDNTTVTHKGIYDIRDDILRICFVFSDSGKPRPADFVTDIEDQRILMAFQRVTRRNVAAVFQKMGATVQQNKDGAIEKIQFATAEVTDTDLEFLRFTPDIEELNLSDNKLSDNVFSYLKHLDKLRHLNLSRNRCPYGLDKAFLMRLEGKFVPGITNMGLRNLEQDVLPNLVLLDIQDVGNAINDQMIRV